MPEEEIFKILNKVLEGEKDCLEIEKKLQDKEEIEDKIQQLERDRIGYLETNNKAGARRKEKQISELQDKLEIMNLKEIKEDLELYKKFIRKRGLQNEFQSFMIIEMANK